jgi:hypothetical protein
MPRGAFDASDEDTTTLSKFTVMINTNIDGRNKTTWDTKSAWLRQIFLDLLNSDNSKSDRNTVFGSDDLVESVIVPRGGFMVELGGKFHRIHLHVVFEIRHWVLTYNPGAFQKRLKAWLEVKHPLGLNKQWNVRVIDNSRAVNQAENYASKTARYPVIKAKFDQFGATDEYQELQLRTNSKGEGS